MKHTKGPWKLHEDGFIYKMDKGNAWAIADPHCTKELDLDEREANARLIAAAPELLEVCQSILDKWHSNAKNFHKKEPEYLEPIRKAITKATQP